MHTNIQTYKTSFIPGTCRKITIFAKLSLACIFFFLLVLLPLTLWWTGTTYKRLFVHFSTIKTRAPHNHSALWFHKSVVYMNWKQQKQWSSCNDKQSLTTLFHSNGILFHLLVFFLFFWFGSAWIVHLSTHALNCTHIHTVSFVRICVNWRTRGFYAWPKLMWTPFSRLIARDRRNCCEKVNFCFCLQSQKLFSCSYSEERVSLWTKIRCYWGRMWIFWPKLEEDGENIP